jgi:hypothetical protein
MESSFINDDAALLPRRLDGREDNCSNAKARGKADHVGQDRFFIITVHKDFFGLLDLASNRL